MVPNTNAPCKMCAPPLCDRLISLSSCRAVEGTRCDDDHRYARDETVAKARDLPVEADNEEDGDGVKAVDVLPIGL